MPRLPGTAGGYLAARRGHCMEEKAEGEMGLLTGWLVSAGLSRRAAGILAAGALILLMGTALWWLRADAYRDGERAADARWQEAQRRLERQAARASVSADRGSAARLEQFNDRVAAEKERIDEANRTGSSPLDVLFGG